MMMKPVQFGAVTLVSGPESQVEAWSENFEEQNPLAVSAGLGAGKVYLTDADSDKFLKDNFDVDVPDEFRGKTRTELVALIESNPQKYAPLVQKIAEAMMSDIFGMIEKVFQYAQNARQNGDAEGNPVQEVNL